MAELPNYPTLSVTIMMGIAFFAVLGVTIPMYINYYKRKRSAALMISISFTFWGLAALITFLGTLLQYLIYSPDGSINDFGLIQYARYGINLGYAFSAVCNIFIFLFISEIFSKFALFKKTHNVLPIVNGILNGVTIGLVINTFIVSIKTTDPTELYNPDYPIPQTVYHLALTLITFLMLLAFSAKSIKQATLKWEKAGFRFIIGTAISAIMIYVFFVVDLVVQDIWPTVFTSGYTIFNNFGWIAAIIMVNLAYIGFFMPNWLRFRYKEVEVK
ncbi:MAG: hypothetical protein JXA54_09990 [Candidatus Heimdallarchaeota archaeon]|nr:hypothetical protein [Candidatus Heimdallarchaeota archaeon]